MQEIQYPITVSFSNASILSGKVTSSNRNTAMRHLVVVVAGLTFRSSQAPLLMAGSFLPDPSCPWAAATTSTPLPHSHLCLQPASLSALWSQCLVITQIHYLPSPQPLFISWQTNTTKRSLTQIHHLI